MSDAAKMEPWRADAERRDCYCAAQRKPCPYHEGYGDGWDAGSDAVLAVVRGVDADQWEQHRAQMTEAGSWAETLETGRVGYGIAAAVVDAILADFARRVVPVVPSPEPLKQEGGER